VGGKKLNGGAGKEKILSRVGWRRVVLDECQMVRSSTTQLAVVCKSLHAKFRWMVSGTPLHAGVDDLNGKAQYLASLFSYISMQFPSDQAS
jgi:SNF2 family DNA or RNA helicase